MEDALDSYVIRADGRWSQGAGGGWRRRCMSSAQLRSQKELGHERPTKEETLDPHPPVMDSSRLARKRSVAPPTSSVVGSLSRGTFSVLGRREAESSATSLSSHIMITKEMEEEEQQLQDKGEKNEREMMEKARQVLQRDSHEMRFRRLQHLLQKSNIYAKFLLTKMEQQQNEEKLKKEKTKKDNDQADGRKRKRGEDFRIADVMTKEEIMSQSKKVRVEEVGDLVQKKLAVEDIEKMSDSNQDIKNRLTETVRDNTKRLFHPDRTVDGQLVPAQQPLLFTGGVMRWYQIEGIEWLRMLWENGINGILADEMGLGKTIQCIAHIAMMIEKKVTGPFLVVAPLSTLPNWVSEFRRFTPQRCQWKYLIVDEGHRIKNLNCRLVRELKLLPTDNKLLLTGTPLQNNLAELWSLLNFLLPEVFDDLKSFEMWFDVDSLGEVESVVAAEREQNILSMLHQILTPFLLRRLKCDVTLEVPPKKEIIVYAPLAPKQEVFYTAVVNRTIAKMLGPAEGDVCPPVVYVSRLSPACPAQTLRETLCVLRRTNPVALTSSGPTEAPHAQAGGLQGDGRRRRHDLDKYLERVRQEQETSPRPALDVQVPVDAQINLKLQNILMLLKRCCNHPYLIDEQLVQSSGKFLILDQLLPELKKRGHKVLIFSQMTSILDLLVDFCFLRGFQYSRLDGAMSYSDREENMSKFSTDPEVFLFLLSTRAGGLGINLTAADTVIIFDSDWNPQADLQAQTAAHPHRTDQTGGRLPAWSPPTPSTRRSWRGATAKRKLEQMVIHKNKFKGNRAELSHSKNGPGGAGGASQSQMHREV
ncbi:unnamed protein product, partial [Lampetra planeri]